MKHREHNKQAPVRKAERSPISRNVPTPFFPKAFDGFVYVERRAPKPRQGMSQ